MKAITVVLLTTFSLCTQATTENYIEFISNVKSAHNSGSREEMAGLHHDSERDCYRDDDEYAQYLRVDELRKANMAMVAIPHKATANLTPLEMIDDGEGLDSMLDGLLADLGARVLTTPTHKLTFLFNHGTNFSNISYHVELRDGKYGLVPICMSRQMMNFIEANSPG